MAILIRFEEVTSENISEQKTEYLIKLRNWANNAADHFAIADFFGKYSLVYNELIKRDADIFPKKLDKQLQSRKQAIESCDPLLLDIAKLRKAAWTAAYINDLPDSAFAYIEPGGTKEEGKTKPRSLRHFPIKDANGKYDAAHVRNALARLSQSPFGEKARGKVEAAARDLGIGEPSEKIEAGKEIEGEVEDALVMKMHLKWDIDGFDSLAHFNEFCSEFLSKEWEEHDISKPYPNEHTARIKDPKQYDKFRRQNNKLGSGIHVIWGIKDSKAEMQAIRFDLSNFSADEAKSWLKSHGIKYISFSSASGKEKRIEYNCKIVKRNDEENIVTACLYPVDEEDAQGDRMNKSEIWKALVAFMKNEKKYFTFMHDKEKRLDGVKLIEIWQTKGVFSLDGEPIKEGDWMMSTYIDPYVHKDVWQKIKNGEITGYSFSGIARAKE